MLSRDRITVLTGSSKLGEGDSYKISRITCHPSYNDQTIDNDACILRIEGSFELSENCKIIKLASRPTEGYHYKRALVSGYGRTTVSFLKPSFLPISPTFHNILILPGVEKSMTVKCPRCSEASKWRFYPENTVLADTTISPSECSVRATTRERRIHALAIQAARWRLTTNCME